MEPTYVLPLTEAEREHLDKLIWRAKWQHRDGQPITETIYRRLVFLEPVGGAATVPVKKGIGCDGYV